MARYIYFPYSLVSPLEVATPHGNFNPLYLIISFCVCALKGDGSLLSVCPHGANGLLWLLVLMCEMFSRVTCSIMRQDG